MTEHIEDDPERAVSTTVNGLPYPDPEDPVAEGAAAIRALAESVKILSGIVVMPSGANSAGVAITFPAGFFSSAPSVTVSASSAWVTASTSVPTTATFSVGAIYRQASGQQATFPADVRAQWIAVGISVSP